jgi:hypothetical protein
MPAGMWHGTWNMDVTFPAHARCRHVVSQWEQLQRAQKDRDTDSPGLAAWCGVPDMRSNARLVPAIVKLKQGANQFFNINGSEDGPRATTTHGGVVPRRNKDTRKHRETGKKLAARWHLLAAQKQISTRPTRVDLSVARGVL